MTAHPEEPCSAAKGRLEGALDKTPPIRYVVVINNNTDHYLTVAEAARRLSRSIEQVRRYLREGRLPGRRIGQQWFIDEAVLASWRPARGGAASRISEAAVVYEVPTMKTEAKREKKHLISDQLFKEIDETAEEIRRESGEFDVVAMVRRDRDEH